jgi:hypothetical protein
MDLSANWKHQELLLIGTFTVEILAAEIAHFHPYFSNLKPSKASTGCIHYRMVMSEFWQYNEPKSQIFRIFRQPENI